MTQEPWMLGATAAEASAEERAQLLAQLPPEAGMAVLATCHRVELYGVGDMPAVAAPVRLHGGAAVERLFRIAAGLESAVLGEDEVLHQVRTSLAAVRQQGAVDPRLIRLFEVAISTGRRARAGHPAPKTNLAGRAVSWLAERRSLRGSSVLVAGTGAMGRALARAAAAEGAEVLTAGRDRSRADMTLEAAAGVAPVVSAIGVALAGPWQALAACEAPLPPIADLSSPPAIPAPVRAALGDSFLDIDRLFERVPGDAAWLGHAEQLVEEGCAEYLGWLRGRGGVELLRALQARSEERRRARLERVLRRRPDLDEVQRQALEQLSRQLVKDLLHEPLTALRADADGSGSAAARRLFGL